MRNIKMVVEYDGSNFKGFQKLKDNENTIQGKLESVLSQMADENIEIIGSEEQIWAYTPMDKL